MATAKKIDLGMTALDDLFSTEQQRQEAKLPKIFNIPISEIDDFPDHPFRVRKDEDMDILKESIKERGFITPAVIRKKEDGRYEMISGHRRKLAATELGLDTIPCDIVDISHDEATILMVDSNLQRSHIGPCEKGKAFKMKMEAIKHQGERTDLTFAPKCTKLNETPKCTKLHSSEQIAEENKTSHTNVYNYIALTNLLPELQDAVDGGLMTMKAGVEISRLDEAGQQTVYEANMRYGRYPKQGEAAEIRKQFSKGTKITGKLINDIFCNRESNVRTMSLPAHLFPSGMTAKEREDYLNKAVAWYDDYLKKQEKRKANREAR